MAVRPYYYTATLLLLLQQLLLLTMGERETDAIHTASSDKYNDDGTGSATLATPRGTEVCGI